MSAPGLPGPMDPDAFRAAAHEAIDWIADYWSRLARMDGAPPVSPRGKPGELFHALPATAPEQPQPWSAIREDLDRLVMPGLTHWQSPGFFGFFPTNISWPGVVGELLSAGLGVNGMLWVASPIVTELEMRTLDWMGRAIGLPDRFLFAPATAGAAPRSPFQSEGGGCIQGTASESTLIALLAAKARTLRGHTGGAPPTLAAYTSTQAHSSVIKAAMVAGLANSPEDRTHLRLIDTDAKLAMRIAGPGGLADQIETDRRAGLTPFFVCATVGTTASGSIDPVPAIARLCRHHHMWLHVDAAYAGAAAVCPEHRSLLDGVEHADSLCFNPHKWLLTNFDCDLMWTSDKASINVALSITPEYLRNAASDRGETIDYRDWQIPLGKRFRALKLWLVMRTFGLDGLREHIRSHLRLAAFAEGLIAADPRFEIPIGRSLGLICFRLAVPGGTPERREALNRRLIEAINRSGRIFLTHAALPEIGYVLRLALGSTMLREEHLRIAWGEISAAADSVLSSAKD